MQNEAARRQGEFGAVEAGVRAALTMKDDAFLHGTGKMQPERSRERLPAFDAAQHIGKIRRIIAGESQRLARFAGH